MKNRKEQDEGTPEHKKFEATSQGLLANKGNSSQGESALKKPERTPGMLQWEMECNVLTLFRTRRIQEGKGATKERSMQKAKCKGPELR